MTLKYIFHSDLPNRLDDILSLLRDVIVQMTGMRALEVMLRYFTVATDRVTSSELRQAVERTFLQIEGKTMQTRLMPEIAKIEDASVLKAIQEAIRMVEAPEELRHIYRSA